MADQQHHEEEDAAMLDPNEAEEIVEDDGDGDAAMDSGDEDEDEDDAAGHVQETIQLQNDSVAHFDGHKDSVYCIAQHPTRPELVATGGGDDTAYVWDATPAPGPVLPASYETNPQPRERNGQEVVAKLGPQDETVNAIVFTLPKGEFIATGTAGGTLNVYTTPTSQQPQPRLVASAKEVDDITWIAPCPSPSEQYANTIALGAADGSVWIYSIDGQNLNIVQSFFLHQAPCTAGVWTPGGQLLATVDEASSLYVWDVFGEAAAAGVYDPNGSQALIQLTADDERFKVDGGLYSAAISPGGGIVAVGGAFGNIRVVNLPRLSGAQQQSTIGVQGAGSKSKSGGAKQAPASAATGNYGQIIAAFAAQTDGVETLDFSQPPLQLLAAGSVDGSIAILDAAKNWSVRRLIKDSHSLDEVPHAVIKVEFVKTPLGTSNPRGHLLTSCGNDGVVRRWDVRGGTASADQGLVQEWKGHMENDGERGGILGFVQGNGQKSGGAAGTHVVTAGDDGVSLVFEWKDQ
ncbi:Putative WD40/YVTN repeat-like-containing domain superfamily [Septoria linicola]|uniref:WD40/YVTN repeat-like-containing domain superfamily n=1 Tax=Septoria linicola TaxID=215465 RepID=A0A9Q9EJD2_9PEZI|nr:putative WD40/YVTN repeat-like-containing domain superfamily [Septoria linicola]USW52905.1 Putative WD40/YVTN repeat-like-containing domain superfamily [Septoria linicola]